MMHIIFSFLAMLLSSLSFGILIHSYKNDEDMKKINELHQKDMKALKSRMIDGLVDLVVCNPPFRRSDSGRINPDHQRAVARHEVMATLSDVILTARRMLPSTGRFAVIYTAERTAELFMQMRANQIEPKVFRSIHSKRHSEAKLVLVEGVKEGRPGIQIKSPLILYNEAGDCTPEMARIFEA